MKIQRASAIIRETRDYYNIIAEDWHVSRQKGLSPHKIKLARAIRRGDRVLDVGCGDGLFLPAVIKKQAFYFGFDISAKLLNIAKKQYRAAVGSGQAQFKRADAAKKFPYPSDYFDRAFSFAVLHHIPTAAKRKKFLSEINRVLKPGGEAVVVVWNLLNDWPERRFKIKEQLRIRTAGLDANDAYVPWKATRGKKVLRYLHVFIDRDLRALAAAAGLKKVQTGYFGRAGDKTANGEDLVLKIKKPS